MLFIPSAPFRRTALVLSLFALGGGATSVGAQQAQSDVTRLSDVVVTASGFEQEIAEAPASITVITKEQLEGRNYRDVTDALQDVPGVSIEGGAGGKIETTSVTIRGMSESYVLFLVDGKPLGSSTDAYYNGFGSATQVGWLPPMSAIERIEVIRGPMSSLYGSSALGGVINLITKKVSDEWGGSVSLETTLPDRSAAGNANQARYYLSGPLIDKRLGLTVYGSIYNRAEDDFTGGYASKERRDNTAKLNWRITDAQSLEFEAGVARHDNERTEKTGAAGEMNNKRTNYALMHDINWGSNFQTKSFLTHEKVEIENGSNESAYKALILNTRTVLPLGSHMLTVGGEYKEEETNHDGSRFPGSLNTDLKRWQTALFVEDEYFLNDRLSLTAGLRYDRNEHFGTHVTPRLYGVYELAQDLMLKGGISGGYKVPSLKQADDGIFENAGRGASWDQGNKDLKPERSTNYEIGLAWATPERTSASLTFYHTRFKDKIDKQTVCGPTDPASCTIPGSTAAPRRSINQYINLDSATLQGLEASFGMPLGPVMLSTNYTWSDSEITSGADKGRPLNDTPRHMVNLGVDWQANAALSFWGKVRYKSKTLEEDNNQRPAYTLVDIGAVYQMTRNVKSYVGIYNIFDRQISSDLYGKTLDGRRYFAGLTVDF